MAKDKSNTVAVIMSVYDGDVLENFQGAVNSIFEQSYRDIDIFIFSDGVSCPNIESYLISIGSLPCVNVVCSKKNVGLACGLNKLLELIRNDKYGYIARMDADDASHQDRFLMQVNFLKENTDVTVLGTNCIEIDALDNPIFEKKMPQNHVDILASVVKRSPLIHPSVMFSGSIINDICYDSKLMNTQDYYLWVDLLSKGYKFHNLQSNLLSFRISNDFYNRRGFKKIVNEIKGRIYAMRKLQKVSFKNFVYIFALFLIRISPESVKKLCYKTLR